MLSLLQSGVPVFTGMLPLCKNSLSFSFRRTAVLLHFAECFLRPLRDTLRCVLRGGIVCNTGILGGEYRLNGFDPIKEIPNGVYLTGFFSNSPSQNTIDELFAFIEVHNIQPKIGASYQFSDIRRACVDLDSGKVNGKIVVEM